MQKTQIPELLLLTLLSHINFGLQLKSTATSSTESIQLTSGDSVMPENVSFCDLGHSIQFICYKPQASMQQRCHRLYTLWPEHLHSTNKEKTHTCIGTYTHNTHINLCTCAYAHTHKHTHTYTHAHTHTHLFKSDNQKEYIQAWGEQWQWHKHGWLYKTYRILCTRRTKAQTNCSHHILCYNISLLNYLTWHKYYKWILY